MFIFKHMNRVLLISLAILLTSFSISYSAPEYSDSTVNNNVDYVYWLDQNLSQKEYLTSYKKDFEKRSNIKLGPLNNETIYLLYKEAYIQMAEKYEYMILPPVIASRENMNDQVFQLYSYNSDANNLIGYSYDNENLLWYSSSDKVVSKYISNSTIKEVFKRSVSVNPFEAPVAIVMNDLVNIFGERVGQFRKTQQEYFDIKGNKISGKVYTLRFINSESQGNIILKNQSIIKVDYEEFSKKYQSCWTCRIIDYSFDAVNYFGYVSQKHLMKYIIILMFLIFSLKIVHRFYQETIKELKDQKSDFKGFVREIAKKVILVMIALVFIQNLNNSLFYYFGRPAVLMGTSIGRYLTEDTKEDYSTCKYFEHKDKQSKLPNLTSTNSSLYDREAETNFFKDKDIDLKKEFICTVYKVQEKNNQVGFLGNIVASYGNMNIFLSGIFWACLWVLTIYMSFFIGLKFVDAIFSIGLSIFFTPFAFIAWAVGDGKKFKWLPNLSIKTVMNSFIKAGADIVVMFIGAMVFTSILSSFFTGAPISLQTMFNDNNYSAAILVNLLEYNEFDFINLIFIFILSLTFIDKIQEEVRGYIGRITVLDHSGSGSHAISGIGGDIRSSDKGVMGNYANKYYQKARSGANKAASAKIKKYLKK